MQRVQKKDRNGGEASASVAHRAAATGRDLIRRLTERVSEALPGGTAESTAEKVSAEPDAEGPLQEIAYMLAYRPDLVPLHDADGTPQLPETLVPLCRLRYSEQVRPEAIETIEAFSRAGVDIKIFSPDAPEHTATILGQAGLVTADGAPARSISGAELAEMDEDQLVRGAAGNTIFGRLSPEQAGQVVNALRAQGEIVAVVGDAASDLAAMQQAHLSITRQSGSPAALSVADIVLLEGSPQALLRVLDKGQRIVNGLLDVLKLYLNQILYLTLLIAAIWSAGLGFPYLSKQGSIITIASVILPSLGLSLWAPPGVAPRTGLGWLLTRFVAPAAVSISAAALVVYRLFLEKTGAAAYTQLVTTYMLVISGLVVVILLRPPVRPRSGGDQRSADWRPTVMVLVLLVLLFVVASIPLAETLFGLTPLRQLQDYLVVGLAVGVWVFIASLLWRIAPLERILPALRR